MSGFAELLVKSTAPFITLTDDQIDALQRHWTMLDAWNRRLNLTSIRSMEEAVHRHYAEALFLSAHLGDARSAVDVGSGAGFPGVPVAIARPELQMTLVESHKRKAVFLRESTRDLPNVRVEASRFEVVRGSFDLLMSRAVAWDEMRRDALRLARGVALLVGPENVPEVLASTEFAWATPLALPASGRGFLLRST